jgi:hypothetical protein
MKICKICKEGIDDAVNAAMDLRPKTFEEALAHEDRKDRGELPEKMVPLEWYVCDDCQ